MGRTIRLAWLLALVWVLGGCWPWEAVPAQRPPRVTPTPPQVEQAAPRFPIIEGRLLYARGGHIWVRTGNTSYRLTKDLHATQPCWSPDGQQIVFVVRGEAYSDIWVMNADGSGAHPVTANESSHPAYTRAFAHSSYWAFQPQWIPPDGTWIGYISHSSPQGYSNRMSIWRIRPDGTEEHRYLALQGHIEGPRWSPDGQVLAFTFFTYDRGAQLRYLDPETGVVRPLGEDVDGVERYDPAWSPDGLWIAYAARRGEETDLWLIPSPLHPRFEETWEPVRITDQGRARGPAWSPDGRQIAFIAEKDDSFDLWVVRLSFSQDGIPVAGDAQQLTAGAHVDATAQPCWAP